MSNRQKRKPVGRNLRILISRAAAEVAHGATGVNLMTVKHDSWCPALVSQSMFDCRGAPQMEIQPVATMDRN